ncbi:type III secretion protein LcrG [Aeromonas jandaei]|nr:type III secretion protein LcrG [Aeromonas jandaei]
MKEGDDSQYQQTIAKAELAIRDSDHRAALLSEMWQSLGISPQVTELLFSEGSVTEKAQAEQELLTDLERRRQLAPQQQNAGGRPRRPAMMRGLVI